MQVVKVRVGYLALKILGICGQIMSFERPVDRRGKVCLANGEFFTIEQTPELRVKVCKALRHRSYIISRVFNEKKYSLYRVFQKMSPLYKLLDFCLTCVIIPATNSL